jgi:ABC-type bacteriocin/lantibiotic exporter with double-glycine peptidase domain
LQTDLSFFEENTCGRIVNRFSKDVKTLDQFLFVFLEMTDYTVKCAFSTAIVIYLYPVLILFAILQMFYLIRLRKQCLFATRDTIRMKFSLVSPVNSLIQDAVNGLPTLKCMGKIQFYMNTLFDSIDTQTSAFITSSSGNRWVAFRIDI